MNENSANIETQWKSVISDITLERKRRGISQAQLSELTGLKQSAISRLENMDAPPQLDTLVNVLNALGLELIVQEIESVKENESMVIKREKIAHVKVELLFCKITITVSQNEEFQLISEQEKEFYFTEQNDGTLLLSQRKRNLIKKFFEWVPIKAELRIPSSFKGNLSFTNLDGSACIQNLSVTDIDARNRNGRLTLSEIKASSIKADSNNGRVKLCGINADDLIVSSDNGSITFADINVTLLKADSDNGRIAGQNVAADACDLKSNNGRIVIDSLKSDSIKLWSKNGRIASSIIGQENEYSMEIEVKNGHSLIAGKKNSGNYIYKDKERPKHISAFSKNGNATFVFSDSETACKKAFSDELTSESESCDNESGD